MNILVIIADCLTVNSSANLCHISYIKGLVELGHKVDLLSASENGQKIDKNMIIPESVNRFEYNGVSLYQKLSMRKNISQEETITQNFSKNNESEKAKRSLKSTVITKIKKKVLAFYGIHGVYATFVKNAKGFKSNKEYDYVLSISTPPSSHLLAHKLIKSGNIKCQKWIQIWEDPWYGDAYGFNGDKKIFNEEKRLLSFAQHICYVSPLTLKNRQKLFPKSADKMFWQPLPSYYNAENVAFEENKNSYGYFGDYAPASRDLKPFYEAAAKTKINVNICGNPSNLFEPTDTINIYPRLPLAELKKVEDKTNVLIFLCNRQGGQIPGKIYQYSATNKTILFILDGTDEEKKVLKNYFAKYNRYVFCENTVEDISRAIKEIESGNLGQVSNEPLDDFDPRDIINNILDCKNG